ncbi:E3 ubiquitin-protein ligase rnf213-alpha-like [Anguilla rostrata]|uniref:E3 ubiquitin-protein ligase rnf213-alpha-like n=1 Tax=Anguilla rostrata TaxID=7938 RepID=UPI0030CAAFF6
MGRQTAEAAQQQSLESAQAGPPERARGVQGEQESDTNPSTGNAGKNPQRGGEVPARSAPTGSPVDTPPPENKGATSDQCDDEGFQTVSSKRKNKKMTHPPQIPQSLQQETSTDSVTVCFHAILSKDFNLDPQNDLVFMVPGQPLGNWNDVVKMEAKHLGEHGYLVQGQIRISRMIVGVPIPYKYAVYKPREAGHELQYEYIYKMDAKGIVNRCLQVMNLQTQQGEWHQYDDIIWAKPASGMITSVISFLGMNEKRDIARGRHLAGKVMLKMIFDLLRSWSAVNVENFLIHLHQFFTVNCSSYVFEGDRPTVWESLGYGVAQVKGLLREFLLENVVPQKEGGGEKTLLRDPLKAGLLITMLVWHEYQELHNTEELSYMCDLLCLPQMPRKEFHVYWRDLTSGFQDPLCWLEVQKSLEYFCSLALKEKVEKWILVLPLLHLLRGDCRPFEPLSPSLTPSVGFNPWAGLREISLPDLQSNSQYTRALMKVMAEHTHLVEVDRLLSRSWLYLLGVEAVKEFCSSVPVDLHDVLQWLCFRLGAEFSRKHEAVQELLVYLSQSIKEQKFRCYDAGYGKNCLTVSLKLLERICQAAIEQRFHKLPTACATLVSAVADFTASVHENHSEQNEAQLNCSTSEELEQMLKMIRDWMRKTFDNKLLRTVTQSSTFISRCEIEAWNNILSLTLGGEQFTELWRTTLLNDFEGKLKKECSMDQIEIYCNQMEEVNRKFPTLSACLEKCALESVTSVCQGREERSLFERLRRHDLRKFGKLVSVLVLKAWPLDTSEGYLEGEEAVLEHLLTWSIAKDIFQLQGTDGKLTEELTDSARERMAVATSTCSKVSNKFLTGNIKMRSLNRILKNKDAFLELLKIDGLSMNERCRNSAMKSLMKFREDEVKSINHERALLRNLLEVCQALQEYITVDLEDLESKLGVTVEEKTLDEFMEVYQPDNISSEKVGVVTCFELSPGVREMAEALHVFRNSFIFKMCWKNQAKALSRSDDITGEMGAAPVIRASLHEIHKEVFQPCYGRYREIYNNLRSGGLTLQEVDDIFEDYTGKYDELTDDLQIMCKIDSEMDKHWIHKRVQQIEQYHELHLALKSVKVIMEAKQILCPQGDFHILDTLLGATDAEFKRKTLDHIDSDLIKVKKEVAMTEKQRLCLQELYLRKNFILWLKEALQDLNELKVFVDLASISAGENDLDVDRVACFHDAVLGYSSVLYELKPDAGFRAFKEALGKLWKALKNDCNLPEKLRDSERHLEWLKTVKESHGSVELSSLSLASAINKKGLYIIRAQNQKKLTLDTTLKLEILEEHTEEAQQQEVQGMHSYTLEDLRELLNKLMLMSRKGDKGQRGEVDHFSEVFSSVQRMALAFIELHAAGNPLFQCWEAKISCQPNSKASIVMDFHLGSGVDVGKVAVEGDLLEQLPELCRKMEQYLSTWKDFMNEQRSMHYYLNYYTAEQVVYLCNRLCPGTQTPTLDGQMVTMLSFIRPGCDAQGLREMLRVFWGDFHSGDALQKQRDEVDLQAFAEEEQVWEEEKEEVWEVEDEKEEEKLKEEEEGEEEAWGSMEVTLEPAFRGGGSVHSNYVLSGPLGQTSGFGQLDLLWDTYMRDMRHFLPHTLDVPSLGRLLGQLANQGVEDWRKEDTKVVRRSLPGGFSSSRPNLVVCPPAEILTSCLCIYMASELEPLPSYDEVLLCDPNTPYQQVELFFRRCLTAGYRGQKIYTLLHADRLAYDVSFKAEQLFQALSLRCTHDYRLVIICSSSREHAYLPSAFSQYRLLAIPQEPLERVRSYLSRHYTVPADQPSAADVFKGRQFVGVVSSKRAGVGKSMYIQRLYEKLKESSIEEVALLKCIRLIEPQVDENAILKSLLNTPEGKDLTIFHFDVMSSVQKGVHEFLFRLLILRYLMDSEGRMWKCSRGQLYLIEILRSAQDLRQNIPRVGAHESFSFLDVFPTVICRPPKEVLEQEMRHEDGAVTQDPLMDDQEFRSEAFQRPYQYLTRFHKGQNLDRFVYKGVEGTHMECLQILFVYCGVADPSWAELRNFCWFLNVQLRDCETSIFCDMEFVGDTLQGFRNFVVDFMILMAKDFATPSLSISDQSAGRPQMDLSEVNEEDLAPFRIRKRWEVEPHPYIFFNGDHMSMTFIGFHLRKNGQSNLDAVHPISGAVIRRNIMTERLYDGLCLQGVPFNVDFDTLPRGEKIKQLCNVLGVQQTVDPDKTYELTTDNMLKMLAIHMRFRCDIPVVVMGETGCGKTRLIRFLCELRRAGADTQNMTLVKVHGGTTSEMIYSKVREAEVKAATNKREHKLDSVLFFDEANTTEAVSSIKEVLCDGAVEGKRLAVGTGLQIIAACNPYRKHSDEMIQRLESAGLGYRVRAEKTEEKLGSIPLRQLVYRVQVLPPSMIPLVWDFGQLNDQTEKIYIQQIVQRVVQASSINSKYSAMMVNALSSSQMYMRSRQDECSFVSLRDVERCVQVFIWFHNKNRLLIDELNKYLRKKLNLEKKKQTVEDERRDSVVWALVMALGVCYHACLENKEGYRKEICKTLPKGYTPQKVLHEITLVQDLLLNGVPLGRTIARNTALKENVFMMLVCIELRIPLFLVGKPGSSKSLSKTLVADAMQGQAAHTELFRRLKQVHLVSFQCSPHSTPEGIINTFKQCARFQEGKNLDEYVSVVVLDEIGLAEDSPKMPLKTLHPLLEEGCIDDEPLPHKKVGFVGISNWALDPAKMNRGVFVSRGDPDEKELIESARGICSSDKMVLEKVQDVFLPFAKAYLRTTEGKGFFGLRDYYSLIKMVFDSSKTSKQRPSVEQIVEAVLRNFSGRDDMDVVSIFTDSMHISPNLEGTISTIELVRKNILAIGSKNECRYLLVLTKNYAALQILQQMFFSDQHHPEIIFGSSFPKDQEYTQICCNINRVKICMETGQTVILLNLQNLYESLYDALNQYYVCLGGQNYVDLGLGTHRVKCRVHPNFRLIVIEEKEVVYRQFPVPLINRLEKHYLDINAVLRSDQKEMVKELEGWVEQFITTNQNSMAVQRQKYQPPDVFIGYHSDACSSVVLQVTEKLKQEKEMPEFRRRVLQQAKLMLLNCATPDSVVRLQDTALPSTEAEFLTQVYFQEQQHSSLAEFILSHMHMEGWHHSHITEVTTFSRLLTASDVAQLRDVVKIPTTELLSLQQFDTEQSFLKTIRNFLDSTPDDKMLIIQTDFDDGTQSACILASAKYSAINEINKVGEAEMTGKVFVYFITKLPRVEGGTFYVGFHGGNWSSVHIDDLRRSKDIVSDIKALRNISISQLFQDKTDQKDPMDAMEVEEAFPEQVEGALLEVLDTTELVRSCVQSAVSMLRDQAEGGARCTRRVEILLTLLADNDETSAMFLKTVKRRIHYLLVAQDSHTLTSKNWVFKEASNVNALQEGGTFKHTLWKRVQVAVTPLLARLVSVLDRDCNLDLLLDCKSGESVKKLWLDMFGDESLLEIPYARPNYGTESQTVLVHSHIQTGHGVGCAMPFSWRVREHLEEVWTQVQHRDDRTQQKFEEIFGKTPLGQLISHTDRETHKELFQRYLQDFVSMAMKVTSEDELQLLCRALTSCINELSVRRPAASPPSLPWVHVAYQQFRTRLHNLHRMLTLLPHLAPPLLGTTPTGETGEMVLDVLAAVACVEQLEPQLQSDAQHLAWLRQVKSLQVPLQLVCAQPVPEHWGQRSRAVIGRVRNGWNRIFVLSLFVEHLLLGVESVDEKLTALLLDHTLRLGRVLEKNSDLKLETSFVAVVEVLKSCKDRASRSVFEYGLGPCPMCCGDPQEPLVLPCGDVFCLGCGRQWLVPGQMFCPKCMSPVPDDFPLSVSEDVSGLIKFSKQCHSFFIELVSSVCFRGNCPPSQGVIHHLLSYLMVEAEPVPLIRGRSQILTKALSPFHESVDRSPVVRSVVLKLLLKYSFSNVREYLQQHLSSVEQSIIVEEGDKCNLYALYINCLEDSLFERLQCHTATERRSFLQVERDFLNYFLSCDPTSVRTVTVEQLQQVARVRLCLDVAAELLTQGLLGKYNYTPAGASCFLDSVQNLCVRGGNDWYCVYLIRLLCGRRGVEFVQNLLKEEALPWLFPQEILVQKNQDGGQMDQYLVCGEGYGAVREAVAKATAGCPMEDIKAACEGCGGSPAERTVYLLLAVFREVTTLYRSTNPVLLPKPELCQALEGFIQNSGVLESQGARTFATALVRNSLGPLRVRADRPGVEHTLTELAVHLSAVLRCGEGGVLAPLRQLAMSPSNMRNSFLPTMPEDMQYMAVKACTEKLEWYTCRNGHPCAIGECGRPAQTGQCLDCGAEIGGVNHVPVTGFTATAAQTQDRTQPGHILGDPSRRGDGDALDTRNLPPVAFAVLRLLTHLALLLGAAADPQCVSQIIRPSVQDPGAFLMQHLRKDLEQLTQTLGLGADDTVTAIHLLLSSLLEPHLPRSGHGPFGGSLSTKEARHGWETTVITDIITPQLKNLEQRLKEVNVAIRCDSRVNSNPVMKVVFGDPRLFLSTLPRDSLVHRGAVWSCRERVSLPHLAHVLGQNGGKDAFPLLWTFLQKEAELRLVKFLPDIVALQRDLVRRFQNRTDLTYGTIGELIQNQREAARMTWEKRIRTFLSVWNQLRLSLATNGEIKIPAELCEEDLALSSDLQVLLPQRQGVGLCSTALVSYLIALHNQLVYATDRHTGEQTSYTVSVTDLSELHVIGYEPERDLIPLVLSNCQYSLERGQETLSQYDLPKIQQLILSRILQGKPLIALSGIPTLFSRQSRHYERVFTDVKAKVGQEPLPALKAASLAGQLQTHSDVCDTLGVVELVLDFLSAAGGHAHMELVSYLEDVLRMERLAPHVLKALSRCSLKHCVALWQFLSSLRSESMLRLKRDPFVGIGDQYRKPLDEEARRLLMGFCSRGSVQAVRLEMHQFLLLHLNTNRDPELYRPDWGLKETLQSYVERKDLDLPPDVEELFPAEIRLSQAVAAWKFTVAFKQGRSLR